SLSAALPVVPPPGHYPGETYDVPRARTRSWYRPETGTSAAVPVMAAPREDINADRPGGPTRGGASASVVSLEARAVSKSFGGVKAVVNVPFAAADGHITG